MLKAITCLIALSICSANAESIHNVKLESAQGKTPVDLSSFKGSPLLVVNIATRCGYTGQLEDLESLYREYKDKGLKIVGIPSNSFGGQTPEKNQEVAKFCRLKYGASFPITKKQSFKGDDISPVASKLLKLSDRKSVGWNFEKFLFNKKGEFVKWFPSSTSPEDESLKSEIKGLL
ncbi:MAG: glutathione peroxidase [Halobacteriovoraceae bacterium]|nr:glutathione peroxidase [Halobacteriovoraceae bacterium]|tara:strand:+ start:552 stop:1079 length:528 start_codon:yes stop_codon:yes gene_type:complete